MTIDQWLETSRADADRRGLPELKPLLTTLAQATRVLRAADWNDLPRTAEKTPAAAADKDAWTR